MYHTEREYKDRLVLILTYKRSLYLRPEWYVKKSILNRNVECIHKKKMIEKGVRYRLYPYMLASRDRSFAGDANSM